MSSILNFATNASLNAKISDVKGETPTITNLATSSALTGGENKILTVNNLAKKTEYKAKNNEIGIKITNHNHNKLKSFIRLIILWQKLLI